WDTPIVLRFLEWTGKGVCSLNGIERRFGERWSLWSLQFGNGLTAREWGADTPASLGDGCLGHPERARSGAFQRPGALPDAGGFPVRASILCLGHFHGFLDPAEHHWR